MATITIHRGTRQIGGCCTEIESNGYKVFIDFGERLPGTENDDSKLPQIEGLTRGDVSKSALFITHYHDDHIGKICDTVSNLPIHMGQTALEIYRCKEKLIRKDKTEKNKVDLERLDTVKFFEKCDREMKEEYVGKITIKPLYIDHSAFDAYMFIVEADGKRILHTGDFRGHGFNTALFSMLRKYATNIDYIICEGTNIQRPDAVSQTEQELQKDFEKLFKENKYNFVIVSSTNIGRIFSLCHAAKKARRCFVCDPYQKEIIDIISNYNKMDKFYKYDNIYPLRKKCKNTDNHNEPSYELTDDQKNKVDEDGFCMLVRTNNDAFKPILDEYCKSKSNETKIYLSMWKGYLDKSKKTFNQKIADFIGSYEYEYKHTSGHADVKTLRALFDIVKPKCGIIPIHTEAPEKFYELFTEHNIILCRDGKPFGM